MLEILSTILDLLPVSDLLRFARVSKRLKDIVYDDTRWIKRLQLMGCWNEIEVRQKAEAISVERLELQQSSRHNQSRRTGIGVSDAFNTSGLAKPHRKASTTIFDAGLDEQGQIQTKKSGLTSRPESFDDGFDVIALSPVINQDNSHSSPSALNVFPQLQPRRNCARHEYGKVHAALSPLYDDAVRCKNHTDAKVFRLYRDPNRQAQVLAELTKFAKSDTTQGWQQRSNNLAALTEAFENAVFREFEQGLRTGDIEGKLPKYAQVLYTLNGGHKSVEFFISNNPIINEKIQFGHPIACLNEGGPGGISLQQSYKFFNGVSTVFNEQVTIIDRVFPVSDNVVIPLLQKVGQNVVSGYLTNLFNETHKVSKELYLKAVSATYEQSLSFARSLRPGRDSSDDFYQSVDDIIVSVFEPHVNLYLNEEIESFKQKTEAEVGDWERRLSEQDASMQSMFMSNVNRQADKRDFLTSFKKVVMMPVNALPTFPMSSPFGGKSATAKALLNGETLEAPQAAPSQPSSQSLTPSIVNGTTLGLSRAASPVLEPPTTELAAKAAIMNSRLEGIRSLFSIEVALNLVHAAKASIERTAVFAKAGGQFSEDARIQCGIVFVLLLQGLGIRHIKAGFDQALGHLTNYKPREVGKHVGSGVTPLVTFLELVNVGDLIQQMLDVFYEQELVAAKLVDRNDFTDPVVKEKKRFEQTLDERVAAGLNKGIEVLMAEVEYVCATTQKTEDFNPRTSNGEVMDIGPSETAKHVVDVVSSHTKMLVGSTEKNMLDVFNQEVGLRLFTSLCKHLKRQRISVSGSIRLIWSEFLFYQIPPTPMKPVIKN